MSRRVVPLFLVSVLVLLGCDPMPPAVSSKAPTPPAVTKSEPPPQAAPAPAAPAPETVALAPAQETPSAQEPDAPKDPPPAPPKKDSAPPAAPIQLSGKGDQVSQPFRLGAGFSTWEITHDGRSNVQISLFRADHEIDMPLNEIGRFRGTIPVRIAKAGPYLINVKADGRWTVTIRQPRPETGEAKPVAKHGRGPDVPCFVTLPQGLTVFRVTHAGDGVFRVKLFDREGKFVDQLFAHIGPYEGSKAFAVENEGTYAIGIYANGEWTLKLE